VGARAEKADRTSTAVPVRLSATIPAAIVTGLDTRRTSVAPRLVVERRFRIAGNSLDLELQLRGSR